MSGHIGTWALAGGLAAAVTATLLWLRLALAGDAPPRWARLATGASLLAAALAAGALEWALVGHDFSIRFVADNGGRRVPLYFEITSMWSALEGSLLLWLLILNLYAALLSRSDRRQSPTLHRYAMTVVSGTSVFFFALGYFAANPFQAVYPVPPDGPGPNPLLQQHPAMGIHPPLLYAGYIGLVVPFGYAVAGLLSRDAGAGWLRAARRWTVPAWALLTAGITLGAWWSYAVLGWGGYWAWDPVENASLLPWLTATAFLHTTLSRRRAGDPGWQVGLASASFLLVLLGTFLTRSAAVASVHAFTESALGPMLLGFVLLAAIGVVVLVGWRGGSQHGLPQVTAPLLSRATVLTGNRILLVTVVAVVLIGTIFPLLTQALSGVRTAVGTTYFNRSVVPLTISLLVLMGLAPLLPGDGGHQRSGPRRLGIAAGCALAAIATVGLLSRPGAMALAAFGSAAFALAGTGYGLVDHLTASVRSGLPRRLGRSRRAFAGTVAHAGIVLVAVGATASSAYPASSERDLAIGESMTLGTTSARLVTVDRVREGDGMTARARLDLTTAGDRIGKITPTLRHYPGRDVTVSVPGIRSGPLRDRYATLVAVAADGSRATIRLAVNPMIWLIWLGGALTAAGGLLALGRPSPRRRTFGSAGHLPATRPATVTAVGGDR